MAESEVVAFPAPERVELPTTVEMTTDEAAATARCNPDEMRMVRKATGRPWSEVFAEGGDDADRMQTMIWLHLMRNGYKNIEWKDCGGITPIITEVDPTNGAP